VFEAHEITHVCVAAGGVLYARAIDAMARAACEDAVAEPAEAYAHPLAG